MQARTRRVEVSGGGSAASRGGVPRQRSPTCQHDLGGAARVHGHKLSDVIHPALEGHPDALRGRLVLRHLVCRVLRQLPVAKEGGGIDAGGSPLTTRLDGRAGHTPGVVRGGGREGGALHPPRQAASTGSELDHVMCGHSSCCAAWNSTLAGAGALTWPSQPLPWRRVWAPPPLEHWPCPLAATRRQQWWRQRRRPRRGPSGRRARRWERCRCCWWWPGLPPAAAAARGPRCRRQAVLPMPGSASPCHPSGSCEQRVWAAWSRSPRLPGAGVSACEAWQHRRPCERVRIGARGVCRGCQACKQTAGALQHPYTPSIVVAGCGEGAHRPGLRVKIATRPSFSSQGGLQRHRLLMSCAGIGQLRQLRGARRCHPRTRLLPRCHTVDQAQLSSIQWPRCALPRTLP